MLAWNAYWSSVHNLRGFSSWILLVDFFKKPNQELLHKPRTSRWYGEKSFRMKECMKTKRRQRCVTQMTLSGKHGWVALLQLVVDLELRVHLVWPQRNLLVGRPGWPAKVFLFFSFVISVLGRHIFRKHLYFLFLFSSWLSLVVFFALCTKKQQQA